MNWHDQAKKLHGALEALCKAVGELPVVETDQATQKAYGSAVSILEPDDFTERFMAQHRRQE